MMKKNVFIERSAERRKSLDIEKFKEFLAEIQENNNNTSQGKCINIFAEKVQELVINVQVLIENEKKLLETTKERYI